MTDLLGELAAFRDARGWARYHTPRNLVEALLVEAGELLECYLWNSEFDPPIQRGRKRKHRVPEDELADVLIYALNLCLVLGVDPEQLVRSKMARNAEKYPVEKVLQTAGRSVK